MVDILSSPLSRAAAPRSVILGHTLALLAGYVVWVLASLVLGTPISFQAGGIAPILCSSLGLALTCFLLVRFSCPHAPACASALIVAVGGAEGEWGVIFMFLAVVLVTSQAVAINRLASLPVPLWKPRRIR